ncbi:hypothetical protein QQ045_030534 [Rhodiola kirilowii]
MDLEPREGYAVIEKITNKYFMWESERGNPRRKGERHEANAVSISDYDALEKRFENKIESLSDEVFKLKHPAKDLSRSQGDEGGNGYEEANYIGGNQGMEYNSNAPQGRNSQSNYTTPRFSSAWRNHPNFSYKTTNPTPPGFGPKPTSNNQAFPPKNQYQSQGMTLLQKNQIQGQQYQAQAQNPTNKPS